MSERMGGVVERRGGEVVSQAAKLTDGESSSYKY
jgi:hypothetical protein